MLSLNIQLFFNFAFTYKFRLYTFLLKKVYNLSRPISNATFHKGSSSWNNHMPVNVWSLYFVSVSHCLHPLLRRLFYLTLPTDSLSEARVTPCIFIPLMICSIAQYTWWLSIVANYFLLQFYILSRVFLFLFFKLSSYPHLLSIKCTVNRLIVIYHHLS